MISSECNYAAQGLKLSDTAVHLMVEVIGDRGAGWVLMLHEVGGGEVEQSRLPRRGVGLVTSQNLTK